MWRLHASSPKVWEANRREDQAWWETAWAAVDDRLGGLEEQVKGVGERVDRLPFAARRRYPDFY